MKRSHRPRFLKSLIFSALVLCLVLGLGLWWLTAPLQVDEARLQVASAGEGYELVERENSVVLQPEEPTGRG